MDSSRTAWTLVYLLSCAVNEKECDLKSDEIDFDGLYSLAKNHAVCSAVAFALESVGIDERRFAQEKLKVKRKLGLYDVERARIYERLNAAGIRFLPLKGIVLMDCYPRYGMRDMTDNDILCDRTRMSDVRAIMESLGYFCDDYGQRHHDSYRKPPSLTFEMHRDLFTTGDTPALDRYYAAIFDRLEPKSGCEYAFRDEDCYLYLLAHAYKHFTHNGTGLRPLLDLYVYLHTHPDLDAAYLARELETLQLANFERHSRDLAMRLFGFQQLSEDNLEMLPLFLDSTLYGSDEHREYNKLTRQFDGRDTKGSKAKYFFDRIFLRGDALGQMYPFFARHKWLLPVLYVYRPFKALLTRPKGIARETRNVVKFRAPKHL